MKEFHSISYNQHIWLLMFQEGYICAPVAPCCATRKQIHIVLSPVQRDLTPKFPLSPCLLKEKGLPAPYRDLMCS